MTQTQLTHPRSTTNLIFLEMSDYEDENFPMDDDCHYSRDYSDSEGDNKEVVVAHLVVCLKRNKEIRDVSLYMKFDEKTDAFDAETDEYSEDLNSITNFISRRHPGGWCIDSIRMEGFSDRSYFDIECSERE